MIETLQKELLINGYPVMVENVTGNSALRVACLGPWGTYTEEAREKILEGNDGQAFDESFLKKNIDVIKETAGGVYDLGVVPAENAIGGDVTEVVEGLIKADNITILGEVILRIRHMLIGREGEKIRLLLSHWQALSQCGDYISNNLPDAELRQVDSTAGAVEEIMGIPNAAAIASLRVAEKYGMDVLASDIGDKPKNTTRFYLLGRGATVPTGDDLTTFAISPWENREGLLYDYLGVFKEGKINLTNVRSYPTGDPAMERYMFLFTCHGHQRDERLARAFGMLEDRYRVPAKILGSYRKAALPEGVREPGAINGQH